MYANGSVLDTLSQVLWSKIIGATNFEDNLLSISPVQADSREGVNYRNRGLLY